MRRWWLGGVALGLAALVWRARPFRVAVEGWSMAPAFEPGDYLVAVRPGTVRRGDVVVVGHPRRDMEVLKRVVGEPGEVAEGLPLGPDEYLVVGDNRTASTDGRAFGPIPRSAIRGVVRFRYWPRPKVIGSG
jgi:signal peptidase I